MLSFRKPEWDWSAELPRAQNGGNNSIPMPELMAAATQIKTEGADRDVGSLAPLFKDAWISRTARNIMIGATTPAYNSFPPRVQHMLAAPVGAPTRAVEGPPGVGGDYYPGIQPGYVVGCTPDIIDECFQRKLFGLPIQLQNDAVTNIQPGTPLFLQDVTTNLLHGLFEAASPAVLNMEPKAFTRGGVLQESMYPVQVKFQFVLQAPVLPEHDPEV